MRAETGERTTAMPEWIEQFPRGEPPPEWIKRMAARAAPASGDSQRVTRWPGSPLLLTREQWALYNRAVALQERQREHFGAAGRLAGVIHLGPVFGGVGLTRERVL